MLDHRSRFLTRPAALVLVPTLALGLAACGDEPSEGAEGFDAVTVSGDFGTTPEFDFSDRLVSGEAEEDVLIEGEGDELADGDQALVNLTVANGFSEDIALDTYSDTLPGFTLDIGGEAAEPQAVGDLFADYVGDFVTEGTTVGTRIAVTVGVDEAFPDYATAFTDYDIGNQDGLVLVADVNGVVADGPDGKAKKAPSWAPAIVEKKGVPSSLDFTGTPEPSGKLQVATLIQGDGPVVEAGTAAVVDYLGQVYQGDKPFDESFSSDRTLGALVGKDVEQFTSTATPVIDGWSQGLEGVAVGSRVLIEIPPSLGYGKKAQGEDIPGNSTLYFVVDVLGVA
ncbi:FKBP-type peptidyl-prolyl cis-trans isomerase [Nocardioides sambongensis]|uniref:FKBP-type peptidyl-prolyl cis-trans isomerase n=1 Tax=Nocardioides sambongensis TaxID=2589074 RepID=UPI001129F709|nr:FKBP-type peptidyl-prolyl cis-trans isomerase [Nocardioides sambongensis]